jgi:hypothetical protein
MAVQPFVTFFMGHGRYPLESLAVLPVVLALTFLFRCVGLSYQEASLALLSEGPAHYRPVRNYAAILGAASSAGLVSIAFTPLAVVWFQHVSGLSSELTRFASLPIRILSLIPALTVLLSFQRAILVDARRTRFITVATVIEVAVIILGLWLAIDLADMVGALAAAVAMVAGRLAGNVFLHFPCRAVVRERFSWPPTI